MIALILIAIVSLSVGIFSMVLRFKNNCDNSFVIGVCGVILAAMIIISMRAGMDSVKSEAILNGSASYVLTIDKDGEPVNTFTWKVNQLVVEKK